MMLLSRDSMLAIPPVHRASKFHTHTKMPKCDPALISSGPRRNSPRAQSQSKLMQVTDLYLYQHQRKNSRLGVLMIKNDTGFTHMAALFMPKVNIRYTHQAIKVFLLRIVTPGINDQTFKRNKTLYGIIATHYVLDAQKNVLNIKISDNS